jgi:hypothetical protein
VLERDTEGRPLVVESVSRVGKRYMRSTRRFSYDPPVGLSWDGEVSWEQGKGGVRAAQGRWIFEDLGEGRTRATHALETDIGHDLGSLHRAAMVGIFTGEPAEGLKERAEAG